MGTINEEKIIKKVFWEDAISVAEFLPVIIQCDNDWWKKIFELSEYTLIDALKISRGDLFGTDYSKRSYYVPDWLEEARRTNIVIITNFDSIPIYSEDSNVICQRDFAHLIRASEEREEYRELNFSSGIYVPFCLRVFFILPSNSVVDPFLLGRCGLMHIYSEPVD